MKYVSFLLATLLVFNASIAQKKNHKIVFDISATDTAEHSTVIRQVGNVLKASPESKIEVVFHGKAVYALVKDKTTFKDRIDALASKNQVVFAACNNSLTRLKISKDELISSATVVPVAILELTEKQEMGWTYIKAGQ